MNTKELLHYLKKIPVYIIYSVAHFFHYIKGWFFVITILIIIFIVAYRMIKYPFWSRQPVLHTYDYIRKYFYSTPFIVYKVHPIKTKYHDPLNVKTYRYLDMTEQQINEVVDLMQCYYIASERILLLLNKQMLYAIMTGHNHPALVSLYRDIKINTDISGCQSPMVNTVGCITSRPVSFFFLQSSSFIFIDSYFVDFICVNKNYKDRKLNRQLLQTHEYNQRHIEPNIYVSIIKSENDLYEGVIPLVKYETHTFHLRNISLSKLPLHMSVIRIHKENKGLLVTLFTELSNNINTGFTTCILPDMGNIIASINANLIYVLCLKSGENIYGYYFFKDTFTHYEDIEGSALICIASFCNTKSVDTFFNGFLYAIREILKIKKYKILLIEDISHNGFLLSRWLDKYHTTFKHISAYYLYNFIYPRSPIFSQQCFFLL